jgi:hypothetical protein
LGQPASSFILARETDLLFGSLGSLLPVVFDQGDDTPDDQGDGAKDGDQDRQDKQEETDEEIDETLPEPDQ